MPITRTTSGLVFSDNIDRADSNTLGGDWIERAGDWAIASNRFSITSTASDWVEHGADPGGEMFVQCRMGGTNLTTFNQAGLYARYRWNGGTVDGYVLRYAPVSNLMFLRRVVAGVSTDLLDTVSVTRVADGAVQMYAGSGEQHGRMYSLTGWVERKATDTTFDANNDRTFAASMQSAFSTSTTKTNFDWLRCTSKYITVTDAGAVTSWRARLLGAADAVLATVEPTEGVAVIDTMAVTALATGVPLAGYAALVVEVASGDDWVEAERYNATGVYPGDAYEFETRSGPSQPVLDALASGTIINASTGPMESVEPDAVHTSTQWQVAPAVGTDWDSPTLDVTSTAFLTSIVLEGLAEATAYLVRARHFDDTLSSPYSVPVEVTTEAGAPVPVTPTVTVDDIGPDFAAFTSSAFAHPEPSATFLALQWQLRLGADPWTTTVRDTGPVTSAAGLGYAVTDLTPSTGYVVRVRHQDGETGLWSAWSADEAFTTLATPAVAPAAPAATITTCARAGIAVTGAAYSHPDSSAHTRTQFRLRAFDEIDGTLALSTTQTVNTPATTYTFPQPEGGYAYAADVRYRDTEGRWGAFGTVDWCELLAAPPVPEFTSPPSGTVVSASTVVSWDVEFDIVGGFEYDVQESADNGATWTSRVARGSDSQFTASTTGRPNGTYLLRVRSCYPVEIAADDCSDWTYWVFIVDRTDSVAFSIRFADYETVPASWTVTGHTDDVTWELVDADLGTTGPVVGLLGRARRFIVERRSAVVFEEIGEPIEGDFVATFAFVPRHTLWYGWRFADLSLMRGGLAYRAAGVTGTPGSQSLAVTANPGNAEAFFIGGSFDPLTGDPCSCGFHSDIVCEDKMDGRQSWLRTNVHANYGVANSNSVLRLRARRLDQGFNYLFSEDAQPHSRGAGWGAASSYLVPTEELSCRARYPQYTVRTSVRREGAGYRLRAQVFGPGMDPNGAWAMDEVLPNLDTEMECGFCGVAIEHIWGAGVNDGMLFTSFSASNLTYGPCEAGGLLGCIEGWRYTDFRDDDITPVYGVGDGMGGVVEADYYTNKECPRPFLKIPQDFSDTDIDFPAGATTIGAITVEIVDKRLTAADQDTGIVTAEMERRQGRRGLLERWRDDRGWVTVFDGIVYESEMDDRLVTIRRHLRDPRERERRVSLFARNETFSLWPQIGPIDPYAERPDGTHLIDGTLVATGGTFAFEVEGDDSIIRPYYFGHVAIAGGAGAVLQQYGYSSYSPDGTEIGTLYPYLFQGVTVRWRDAPGDPWTYVRDMRIEFFAPMFELPAGGFGIYLASDDLADLPAAGGVGFVQILAARTTQDTPFFWDRGSFGDLLLEIYEGDHTLRPPKIRYDAAAVAAWALVTPPARFSLTEPADAVREWVEQNIFAPLAHAPALNADYRLFPLSGLLPPEGEELQAIDADEVYPVGSWRHGVDNAINVARYTYLREFVEPGAAPIYQRLATREVTVETRNIEGIDAVGEKDWTFSPITVREVGDETGGPLTATTQDEASAQLARQVTQGITDRYFEGVQEVEVGVRAIYPEIMDITVGQWLDVSLPWMPDYLTARRGLRRFMQVLGVRDEDLHRRVLRLEDGGPITDALLPPCIESVDATVNREILITIALTETS